MWKPTKAGAYLCQIDGTMRFCLVGAQGPLEPETAWSLLAPDWQPGAPTAEQLKRWKWWALEFDGEGIYAGRVKMQGPYLWTLEPHNPQSFTRSAPIQPGSGVRWVPLEVANNKREDEGNAT